MKNQPLKTLLIWGSLIALVILIYHTLKSQESVEEIAFSKFIELAIPKEGYESEIKRITVKGNEIKGVKTTGEKFRTYGDIKEFQKDLVVSKIDITYEKTDSESLWFTLFISWLPIIFFILLLFFFIRQIQSGGGKALSFGKSRHRLLREDQRRVTFADIAGIDDAKEELQEIIEFLKNPKKFTRLGGRIPKGVLLMGPPGTGKTLLAKGVAGEAGVPFFTISGSDFVEMFVGVGASRVRDLFEQAKKNAPCIVFIDEIDAVGRHRGAGLGGGHDEREQTLNQLLVEMDGFESKEGVIIIAATNRPDVIDPALLRPGRFDRRVYIQLPDVKGREEILKVHTRKTPLGDDVNLQTLARGTPGFAGAELENIVNEAALIAARENKEKIAMKDFELAKDKVLMGAARKNIIISEREKKIIAYHEAGHTLVAKSLQGADPIHKVTIIPRGMSLGQTQQLPLEERYNVSKKFASNQIAILLGGRVAEEIIFDEQTTGAGHDIETATNLARKMVCEWGMSNLGTIAFGRKDEQIFLGKELAKLQTHSEQTAVRVDREIKRLIVENYDLTREIISSNVEKLHRLAAELLEKETLDGHEIDLILGLT